MTGPGLPTTMPVVYEEPDMAHVRLTVDGSRLVARRDGFFGPDLFAKSREVFKRSGLRWNGERGPGACDTGPAGQVVALCAALREAGIEYILDSAAQSAVSVVVEEAKAVAADPLSRYSEQARAHVREVESSMARKGLALYPFQAEGIAWLRDHPDALLADEMGLGKTWQYLLARSPTQPTLIVTPAVAKINVARECRRLCLSDRVYVVAAMSKRSAAALYADGITVITRDQTRWPSPAEIVITNYESLPSSIPGVPAPNTRLVGDEIHRCKNSKAQRTKRFWAARDAVYAAGGHAWVVTGSPLANRPPDLWAVLEGSHLGNVAFRHFGDYWRRMGGVHEIVRIGRRRMIQVTKWTGAVDPSVPRDLARVMLRRRKADVLASLPPKAYEWHEVEIGAAACREMDRVESGLAARGIALDRISDSDDLDEILSRTSSAIKEILGGVGEMAAMRAQLAGEKVDAMLDLISDYEDANEPLVVMSAHRAPIDALSTREGWRVITGDTSMAERDEIVRSFQAGDLLGVGCTIRAAGVAITLSRASHALFVDREWSVEDNAQAEDRIHRIGQAEAVTVATLVAAHPLERHLYRILTMKQRRIDASVNAAAQSPAHLEAERIAREAHRALQASQEAVKQVEAAQGASGASPSSQAPGNGFHAPSTPVERWVANGLTVLAACDPDRALELNGRGFNQVDGTFGHDLAAQVAAKGGLTDRQYAAAAQMLAKYGRQIGPRPPAE